MMLQRSGIVIIFFVLVMLYGCSAHVDDDVVKFVQEVKNKKSQVAVPLPPFLKPQNFQYTATGFRDPFAPFFISTAEKPPSGKTTSEPDLNRPKGPLEAFPLDSLAFVGTLERDGDFVALIRDNTGIVHIAKIGEYMGQNSGKIVKINASSLSIRELLPNSRGVFQEYMSVIPLRKADNQENKRGH
jgi:type IV pilus assembly protein PilP